MRDHRSGEVGRRVPVAVVRYRVLQQDDAVAPDALVEVGQARADYVAAVLEGVVGSSGVPREWIGHITSPRLAVVS